MDALPPPNVFGVVPTYGHARPPPPSWARRLRRVGRRAGRTVRAGARAAARAAALALAAAALLRRRRERVGAGVASNG